MKPTIKELYPDLSPEEQAEAETNLKRYAAAFTRIYLRKIYQAELSEQTKNEESELEDQV